MDLEVVGRHALLFDDDSTAAFVNSGDALVDWNSLQIDRYDVRHLLSAPPPSRRRTLSSSSSSSNLVDASIQLELDHERYLDLPPPSDEPEIEEGEESADAGAYRAVGFSYGNTDDFADRKSSESQESSDFRPSFPVPESLKQCLPPTEKLHQIIARTALFVSKHGGQSEIVLRVKQGDNPTFGFLMPDHGLHAYFRFLVDHPEILQSDSDLNTQSEGKKTSNEHKEHDGVGGALSMLGSVYGFGEDEETANGDDPESRVSSAAVDALDNSNISRPLERAESSSKAFENGEKEKDEKVSTHSLHSSKDKEKGPALKKNKLISASKSESRSSMRKEDNFSSSAASEKTKADISGIGAVSKTRPLVEPPSELKKLIEKIVEFILKNGKQFESTLMEQDSKHGRFPFLLPSNQYHPYYLKVLQKAQESKVHGSEKRSLKGSDSTSFRSAEHDLPYAFDKKEKFTMVIGKSKKETQDSLTRTSQQEAGVNVDAAAAAAILQAATRGIKNPNLSIISGSSKNGDSQGHSSEGAQASSFLNVPLSGSRIVGQKSDKRMEHSVLIPKVKEIAKSAAAEAASEADSSEAHLSKEQKLKAERLRRAKMFVALLKGGAAPAKGDSLGGSVERRESALSGSITEVNVATKEREGSAAQAEPTAVEREGSTAPLTNNALNENEISEMKHTAEEHERRSRRKYRLRSGIHEDEDEEEEGQEEEEGEQRSRKKRRSSRKDEEEENGEARDDKRSRKKRRSRRHRHKDGENADEDEDDEDNRRSRKKHHRRHSSDEDDDEQRDAERHRNHGRKKHSSHRSSGENRKDDYEGDHKHSKKKHRSHRTSHRSRDRHEHRTKDSSDDESDRSHRTSHRSKDRHKHRTKHSSDDEPGRKHKRASSSDDEEQRYDRADKNEKGTKEREELEEGEILTKVSDQSRASLGGSVSREASVDVSSAQQRSPSQPSESNEISDDLRAKIRAMLMATRM